MWISKFINRITNKFRILLYGKEDYTSIAALRKRGVKIGNNVDIINSDIDYGHGHLISIGDNTTITGARILSHDASTKKFLGYSKIGFVTIGDNVFIGMGAIVLPGSNIGNNVIIGAGCVIASDVPDNTVMIGNPAERLCSFDEYIKRNKERLEGNEAYISNKLFNERDDADWEELKAGLRHKKYGFDL